MERIKWAEESRSKDAELESKCQLIWEGSVPERSFGEASITFCEVRITKGMIYCCNIFVYFIIHPTH